MKVQSSIGIHQFHAEGPEDKTDHILRAFDNWRRSVIIVLDETKAGLPIGDDK